MLYQLFLIGQLLLSLAYLPPPHWTWQFLLKVGCRHDVAALLSHEFEAQQLLKITHTSLFRVFCRTFLLAVCPHINIKTISRWEGCIMWIN
jgi:hypothetical protein